MGKTFKRYNESTKKWENVYAPETTVIQQLEDGSNISDTNVVVTNYNYAGGDEENVTLDDTLTVISDDISRLQRNVSWLAEHGGGGGNGGGGSSSASYGIIVVTPTNVTNGGSVLVDSTGLTVTFMITGGTQSDPCTYYYQYDSETSSKVETTVGKEITVNLDLTKNSLKEHVFIIRATNMYGTTIAPLSFTIYRSSLSIWFDTGATTNYDNGIFSIMQNDNVGTIPLKMSNGLVGSITTISVYRGNELRKQIKLPENTTTNDQKIPGGSLPGLSFWDIVDDPVVNEQYVIYIDAAATIGNTTVNATRIQVRVKVINPDELTISLGVNGNGQSSEPIEVELDSTMRYNFKCYAPIQISNVYYSAKIVKNNSEELILGSYYDDTLKLEGFSYTDNPYAKVETTIYSQYSLSDMKYDEDDVIYLSIKVWGAGTTKVCEIEQAIKIVQSNSEIFPRQYPVRAERSTMFASWNRKNVTDTTRNLWNSTITDYSFMYTGYENNTVSLDLNVINGNNSSGLISSTSPRYLRLQNRAYALIDLSGYSNEIFAMTLPRLQYGFTISITFMADVVSNTNKTVFLWGENDKNDNKLISGIRIDLDKIYWAPSQDDGTSSCNISPGTKHTVDFSFDAGKNIIKIYVNGILNLAAPVSRDSMYPFAKSIVLGANYRNSTYENFCDVNIYELAIYTQMLNDIQIIINGKNARLNGSEENEDVKFDYKQWKQKNFFIGETSDSYFFDSTDSGSYRSIYNINQIDDIKVNSNIPTLTLSFPDGKGFTKEYFLAQHDTSETAVTYTSTMTYFDPETKRSLDSMKFDVSLQGTSTLMYRIKNLEIISAEEVEIDGEMMPVLFQPKKTWFPEKQFTLKADVVDSSHANNAVIGEWVNNSSLFDMNPAMEQFEPNRPKEVDTSGTERTHKIENGTEYINYDESVTIKHTLEGFPVLLFIHFDSEEGYSFAGIYSFNLGRYSYYNMGMKFLSCFSRGDDPNGGTPRKITYYKESDRLGSISVNDIRSFEFDNEANSSYATHPTWTQYDASIVENLGSFRYPSISEPRTDPGFIGLCSLFESVAKARITPTITTKFENIYPYRAVKEGKNINYVVDGTNYIDQNGSYVTVTEKIDLNNSVAYFIVANAFGMTDSLAKNLTLRTWDGGQKWWPCFYDMDTALGISNTGTEDTPVYVAIDKVLNDEYGGVSFEYHNSINNLGYSGYLSKLWGLFRDPEFMYGILGRRGDPDFYIQKWAEARKTGGDLASSDNFANLMANRVETCGEIIYNCDYNSKYVATDDFSDSSENIQAAETSAGFLHGTRVEFVRRWLKNHFYFLDGVFDPKDYTTISNTYDDSPYLSSSSFIFNASYPNSLEMIPFRIKTSTPTFIRLGFGNDDSRVSKFYISSSTETQTIYIQNASSTNTAIIIAGSTLLTEIEGINVGFRGFGEGNAAGSIHSLEAFNISNSQSIQQNGIGTNFLSAVMKNGESPLEIVNLSNSKAPDADCELNLRGLKKVLSINISNSDVSTLILPDSSLDYLNVTNSKISSLNVENQNKLTDISIEGCDNLVTFSMINCDKISGISISDKISLRNVQIENNDAVSSITIDNCTSLTSINIGGNSNLSSITISNCEDLTEINIYDNTSLKYLSINNCANKNLAIKISGSELQNFIISGIETSKPVALPSVSLMGHLTSLEINNAYEFGGFKYGEDVVEMYEEEDGTEYYVLNLTPMTSLSGSNMLLRNVPSLKYIRVANDDNENKSDPFEIVSNSFAGSTKNLVKIFGYIKIVSSPFNGMRDFYLNHDTNYSDPSKTSASFIFRYDDRYYTNVTFDSTDLSGWFSNTKCDINDVYYILMLCDENTRNLGDLFSGCGNVITDDEVPLRPDTFANCTGVNNIDGIFNGCQIGGTLSDPMVIDGHETSGNVLLEPLIGNLTTFNNVFSGNYKIATVENCFFPEGCAIKTLNGFNPQPSDNYLNDASLLSTLTELEVIESSFNDAAIDFARGTYDSTELFKNNTKLISVKDSFVNIMGVGSLRNIFGEYSDEPIGEAYPSNLSSITHSFIFAEGFRDFSVNGEDSGKVAFPIGNSLFKRIKNSITYIGNAYPGQNKTDEDYYERYLVNCGSFTGPGLMKYLANDEFSFSPTGEEGDIAVEPDDCNGEGFPYHIFDGCTKIKEVTSLFEGVVNLKGYSEGHEADISVSIPGNMFMDPTGLTNISRMFKDMSPAIKCTLTSGGFKKLSLVNIDRMFSGINLVGSIPFKLFYQEKELDYEVGEISGLTEQQATALGISDDSGSIGRTLSDSEYTVFSGKYKAINPTIEKMASTLSNITSTSVTHYTAAVGSLDDLTEDNPSYSPLKYILDGENYTKNENFDPRKKVWNKFVFDNDPNFYVSVNEIVANLPSDEYGYPIVNISEIPEEFTEHYIQDESTPILEKEYFGVSVEDSDIDLFMDTNYFCPPDVLRYCKNDFKTDVSYVFSNGSGQYNKDTHTISGYRGKIPTFIFEPISELTAVTGTFSYNLGLFPYRWAENNTSAEYMGILYYPHLLDAIPKVASISGMFSGTRMWGHTKIPSELFSNTTKITNLSGLWSGCEWISGNSQDVSRQILPADLFYPLSRLVDASYLFSGNGTSSVPYMIQTILTRSQNGSVNNVSGFMQNATQTKGTAPEFWNETYWPTEPKIHEGTYSAGNNSWIQGVDNKDAIEAHTSYWRSN